LPSLFLTSSAAAGSVGMINSIGNLGGFLGPTVMGWVDKTFGSYSYGLLFLSCTSVASAALIAMLPLRVEAAAVDEVEGDPLGIDGAEDVEGRNEDESGR
jgi:ACS family tartrate transporter-like MFS transporter